MPWPWLACPRILSNAPTCQSPQTVSTTPTPVSSDVDSVSDFAAALLTKGSAHYRVENQVVVKLPGSFTLDTTSKGLIDEEVYA